MILEDDLAAIDLRERAAIREAGIAIQEIRRRAGDDMLSQIEQWEEWLHIETMRCIEEKWALKRVAFERNDKNAAEEIASASPPDINGAPLTGAAN